MLTKGQARRLAADHARGRYDELPPDDEVVIMDDATIERPWGWVFFHTSQKWLQTKDVRYAVAGNAPIIVECDTGRLIETGTLMPAEYYISNYERCGDPEG